jgi:hypothetical protein
MGISWYTGIIVYHRYTAILKGVARSRVCCFLLRGRARKSVPISSCCFAARLSLLLILFHVNPLLVAAQAIFLFCLARGATGNDPRYQSLQSASDELGGSGIFARCVLFVAEGHCVCVKVKDSGAISPGQNKTLDH